MATQEVETLKRTQLRLARWLLCTTTLVLVVDSESLVA